MKSSTREIFRIMQESNIKFISVLVILLSCCGGSVLLDVLVSKILSDSQFVALA